MTNTHTDAATAGDSLNHQAANRASELSDSKLFDDYLSGIKNISKNMGKDISDCKSAADTDKKTISLLDQLITKDGKVDPKIANEVVKLTKTDEKGDVDAGGSDITKGRATMPTDLAHPAKGEGMDGKNARADARVVADAQEIMKHGVGPDGGPLTDTEKAALKKTVSDSAAPASKDGKSSLNDIPLERDFYKHDQELLKAIKSGNTDDIRKTREAVASDRKADISNELGDSSKKGDSGYVGNDKNNLEGAKKAIKAIDDLRKADVARDTVVPTGFSPIGSINDPLLKNPEGISPSKSMTHNRDGIQPKNPLLKNPDGVHPSKPMTPNPEGMKPQDPLLKKLGDVEPDSLSNSTFSHQVESSRSIDAAQSRQTADTDPRVHRKSADTIGFPALPGYR